MVEMLAEYVEPEIRHCAEDIASSCSPGKPSCYYATDAAMRTSVYSNIAVNSSICRDEREVFSDIDEEARSAISAGLAALTLKDDGDY